MRGIFSDKYLNMLPAERRTHYKCGKKYVVLEDLTDWPSYARLHRCEKKVSPCVETLSQLEPRQMQPRQTMEHRVRSRITPRCHRIEARRLFDFFRR